MNQNSPLSLSAALKSQIRKDSNPIRKQLFDTYKENLFLSRILYNFLSKSLFLKTVATITFGILSCAKIFKKTPYLAFYKLPNERKIIFSLTKNLSQINFKTVSLNKNIFDRIYSALFFCSFFFLHPVQSFKAFKILKRICKSHHLYVGLRASETLFSWVYFNQAFSKEKPKWILLSTEGSPYGSALLNGSCDITFASHGTISEIPSPIRCTLAIFSGRKALDDYEKVGASFNKVLFFGHKDIFKTVKRQKEGSALNVCINLSKNTPANVIWSLIDRIKTSTPSATFLIRNHPHGLVPRVAIPSNKRSFVRHSNNSHIKEDLANSDIAIAGNTNAHMDALLHGIPSFFDPSLDATQNTPLSFIQENLILEINRNDFKSQLNQAYSTYGSEEWKQRFSEFNDLNKTQLEFHSELTKLLSETRN